PTHPRAPGPPARAASRRARPAARPRPAAAAARSWRYSASPAPDPTAAPLPQAPQPRPTLARQALSGTGQGTVQLKAGSPRGEADRVVPAAQHQKVKQFSLAELGG